MIPYSPYTRRSYQERPQERPVVVAAPERGAPDLQTQLEALFDSVWKAEADWLFNDRLDMALKTRRAAS